MKKVLVPLANGFEDIEAVAVIDILRRGRVDVVTASLGYDTEVMSAHGIPMRADAPIEEVLENDYDAIILPGGGEGTENLRLCEPLLERLRRQKEEGRFVCAICAAPTVLAAAGVLEHEQVTCYPTCVADLGRESAGVPVVADGQVITGQAPGAAILFGLALLHQLMGDDVAHRVADGMVTRLG